MCVYVVGVFVVLCDSKKKVARAIIGYPLHPLLQRKYALLKVYIYVGRVYTNASCMRCLKWRCKDLLQHLFMCW